jgi:hypothetical protein
MKLSVLIDQSGKILATQYTSLTTLPPVPSSHRSTNKIRPSVGQSLHEIELPTELEQHVLENTFAREIFKYRAERQGEVIRLIKVY